jgi:predicted NUDIX family NTP pyrophosphohydrolase
MRSQLPNGNSKKRLVSPSTASSGRSGRLSEAGGKIVTVWALEHDLDPALMKSNTFKLEWAPRSGKMQDVPEVDSGGWFSIAAAQRKLLPSQLDFLMRLAKSLGG